MLWRDKTPAEGTWMMSLLLLLFPLTQILVRGQARIARIEVLAQTIRRANGLWDVARKMCVLVGYTTLHLLFSLTIVKQV